MKEETRLPDLRMSYDSQPWQWSLPVDLKTKTPVVCGFAIFVSASINATVDRTARLLMEDFLKNVFGLVEPSLLFWLRFWVMPCRVHAVDWIAVAVGVGGLVQVGVAGDEPPHLRVIEPAPDKS